MGVLVFQKIKNKNLLNDNKPQKFKDKILISKIRFNYKNKMGKQLIFDNLNLKIKKVIKYLLLEIVDQEKVL